VTHKEKHSLRRKKIRYTRSAKEGDYKKKKMGMFSTTTKKKAASPKKEEVVEEEIVVKSETDDPTPTDALLEPLDVKKQMTGKDVFELVKEEAAQRKMTKKWMAFTAVTLLLMAFTSLSWTWFFLKQLVRLIFAWRKVLSVTLFVLGCVFILMKNVIMPVACLLGNLWFIRGAFVRAGVRLAKEKKGVILRELTINGNGSWKHKRFIELLIGNVGLKARADEAEELVLVETLSASVSQPNKRKLVFNLDVVLDGVVVNVTTYDMRFKDTNIKRFLAAFAEVEEEKVETTLMSAAEKEEKKKEEALKRKEEAEEAEQLRKDEEEKRKNLKKQPPKEKRLHIMVKLKNIKIVAKSFSKHMGTRQLGAPITIDEEIVDLDMLSSKAKLATWLNAFLIRQIASGGFNIATSAVDGVSGLAMGVTNGLLGGVDSVAGRVPGGSMIKGVTGGARSVVGGTLGGVGKITHGVAGGGKAIVGGITSGSVSGMRDGFTKAGNEVGGGIYGGVKSIGGGVAGAGTSMVGGVVTSANGSGLVKKQEEEETKEGSKEETTTPKKKKRFSLFKSSSSKKRSQSTPPI